jgi:hypothetical protein
MMKKIETLLQLLPLDALSMLTGKLLGDANLTIEKTRRPRLRFSHAIHDKTWCFYCYQELSKYIKLARPKYRKIIDPRTKMGFTEHYYVQSFTSEVIDLLKDIWYPNGKKTVPFSLLPFVLTPICLAWWYQDDGHLKIEKNQVKKIILSTDGFSAAENEKLIESIYQLYKLEFSLDKQNRLILYDQPQIFYFVHLIKPYVHESMHRKIQVSSMNKKITAKRTTIYLPTSIPIKKPTRDIHKILERLPFLYTQLHDKTIYDMLFKELFPKLKIDKKSLKPYQIQLNVEQRQWLYKFKEITGLNMSQIVHLCAFISDDFNV